MNEGLSHNDFEEQLKDAADNFMLDPSDKVWAGINDELHLRKRIYVLWWAAGILLLVALGTYVYQRHDRSPVKPAVVMKTHVQPAERSPDETIQPPSLKEDNTLVPGKNTFPLSKGPAVFPGENSVNSQEAVTNRRNAGVSALPVLENIHRSVSGPFDALSFQAPLYGTAELHSSIEKSPLAVEQLETPSADESALAVPKKQSDRKSALTIFFTPSTGYRVLKSGSPPSPPPAAAVAPPRLNITASRPPDYRDTKKLRQRSDWGWTAGAQAIWPFGKSWAFQTGVSITKTGYRVLAYDTYPVYIQNDGNASFADVNNTNSFYTVNSVTAAARTPSYIHNRYLAAEIPLLISWQFGRPQKIFFTVGAGAGIFYLVESDAVIYSPESKRYFTDKNYMKPVNGNLHLGTDIHIPLSGKLQILVGPSFQYQIFSTYRNYPQVKEHPFLLGIKTGLQWQR